METLIPVLVATGFLTALSETVRWFLTGRGRNKVDQAKVVQGMALDMLKPLHDELDQCHARLADLRTELDSVLGYALIAHALLETPQVQKTVRDMGRRMPVPPPTVLRRRD